MAEAVARPAGKPFSRHAPFASVDSVANRAFDGSRPWHFEIDLTCLHVEQAAGHIAEHYLDAAEFRGISQRFDEANVAT